MNHILICGAAGYTNLGDDAILWGMLTELRAALGSHAVKVAGGPELAPLVSGFDASAISYDDRPELARAIEDADLVILGGGGMLYDVDYSPSLVRFLTEPPDRQWLYELAKITAAARAAGRPVMVYGMGIGPLITGAARQVARFISDEAKGITVRDASSADVLAMCGVPRSRVFVAADPAISADPGDPERAQAFLEQVGLVSAPRPLIALNLRPWFRFGGVNGGPDGGMERLISRSGELVRVLSDRLGASVALMPLQRLHDDDRHVLEQVLAAAGGPSGAVVLDPPASPPEVVALLARCDLMIGMRLHSLVLAVDAGIPFVALPYVQKVWDFVTAMGVESHAYAAEEFEVSAVVSSCEALLSNRDAAVALLAERRAAMRQAAAVSPEIARSILEGNAQPDRTISRLVSTATPAQRELRVLMQIRPDFRERPGGDVVQLEAMLPYLRKSGVAAELTGEATPDLTAYDLVHVINLDRPEEPYQHCLNALAQGKPVVLSTVHTDLTEFLEWGDTDYWDLPDPGQGSPICRKAPPPDAVQVRRRAVSHLQRQAVVDWSTVYLPNARTDAEYCHRAYGMDLSRTVVVPHGIAPVFFDARPEPFVEKYGLKDFVICAARVEKRKNQLSLVAALRGTGIPLVIVGQPNPGEYRDLCRRYADKSVVFLDAMRQDELASAFAAAKVHALVSWFEIPGLVSLEAGAAGCNIVSSDRGSPPEYLQDMARYCDPARVESIREAVLAAYQAPRSDRLQARIRANYTWEAAAEKTVEGYQLAMAIHECKSDPQRQADLLKATQQHADWLARVVADREYEIQRLFARCQELEGWAREVEKSLADQREELRQITSRRLYRWCVSLAHAAWGILRALGIKRCG